MINRNKRFVCCLFAAVIVTGCSKEPEAGPTLQTDPGTVDIAESIYFSGDILTMNDEKPTVEAVAVKDGKILATGDLQQLQAHSGESTRWIDLQGRTLLPGFFDSHSHLVMTAVKMAVVSLDPPPAGPVDSIASMREALLKALMTRQTDETDWLVGWGYDHVMLAQGRHPTRLDLDKISTDVPIMVIHYSGHQVTLNSKALALSNISASTEDPDGGRIFREAGSRQPSGILQETAIYPLVLPLLSRLTTGTEDGSGDQSPTDEALQRIQQALASYASRGFTTVTEMGATHQAIAVLQTLADRQLLNVDVIAMAFGKVYTADQVSQLSSAHYSNHFRVGGAKLILDGGSPGRSAYLLQPYHEQLPGEDGFRGFPHFQDQVELNALVREHSDAGNRLYIHALGDAAVGQAITALQSADTQTRTQLIHVQQVTEDQLDQIKALGATLSFQAGHNYYFGDFHQQFIYGPDRTARLNPAGSALSRGISVSIHHDSPVHPVDQMLLIWTVVNRVTRSGQVIGEDQRIPVIEALKASTINAAYQFFEEDQKGSLEAGKLADMVILSENPLKVDPMDIRSIQILETIKQGNTVFRSGSTDTTVTQ